MADPAPGLNQSASGPHSAVMARLTLSAIERASEDPNFWKEPVAHRAVLVSGLSVLISAMATLRSDLG